MLPCPPPHGWIFLILGNKEFILIFLHEKILQFAIGKQSTDVYNTSPCPDRLSNEVGVKVRRALCHRAAVCQEKAGEETMQSCNSVTIRQYSADEWTPVQIGWM